MIFLSRIVASRLLLSTNPLIYFWAKFELRFIPCIFYRLFFLEILCNFFCIWNFRSWNICWLRKLLLRSWLTEIKTIKTCCKIFLIIADVTLILWALIKDVKRILWFLRWCLLLFSSRLRCWSSTHSGKQFTLLCRWCLKLSLLIWPSIHIFFFFKQVSILIYAMLPLRLLRLLRSRFWSFITIIGLLLRLGLCLRLLLSFKFIKFFLVLIIGIFIFIVTEIKIWGISLFFLFPIDLCSNSTKKTSNVFSCFLDRCAHSLNAFLGYLSCLFNINICWNWNTRFLLLLNWIRKHLIKITRLRINLFRSFSC